MKVTPIFICCLVMQVSAHAADTFLSHRNTEVPFCYFQGDTRSWPFLEEKLPAGSRISFVASQYAPIQKDAIVLQRQPDGEILSWQLAARTVEWLFSECSELAQITTPLFHSRR